MSTNALAEAGDVPLDLVRTRLDGLFFSERAWVIACLIAGGIDAFLGRHAMNPDGMSYLEMAQTTLRVGLAGLVNGLWSPGYPALIAVSLRVARPAIESEFPVVHALNFVIFAATVLLWSALLRSWVAEERSGGMTRSADRSSALVPIGFGMFLWIVLATVPPSLVTPDLGVIAATILIVLSYQRLRHSGSWESALALGTSCALAYWMKSAMFPLSAALLLLLFVFPPRVAGARRKILTASAVWLALSAPLVFLISANLGRPSYGEAGHLNYSWHVLHANDLETSGPFSATLVHPPRVLLAGPRIIEFGSPIPGTFPLHYDHSYWSEGTPAPFVLSAQVRALAVSGFEYAREGIADFPVILATLIGLAAIYREPRRPTGPKSSPGLLLIWSVLWLALYALVHVEARYTAAPLLLVGVVVARWLLPGTPLRAAWGIAAVLAACVFLKVAQIGWWTIRQARDQDATQYLTLASGLTKLGLAPGTRIAIIGRRDGYDAEYAHAARLLIAAEVVDDGAQPPLTNDNVGVVKSALARAGVRAIVRTRGPLGFAESEWRRIPFGNGNVAGVLFTTP